MGIQTIKMPDIGEGIAEAEITELTIAVGEPVKEDEVFASVMTDKAVVEIPSTFSGKITWYAGGVGDKIPVGAPFVKIDVPGMEDGVVSEPEVSAPKETAKKADAPKKPEAKSDVAAKPAACSAKKQAPVVQKAKAPTKATRRKEGEKPLAAPSIRDRARKAGVDLRMVMGSGPAGRITHDDLDTYLESGGQVVGGSSGKVRNNTITEVNITGMRRKIAERMQEAKRHIPHISIVEEVDVTSLEELRAKLNEEARAKADETKPKLTLLPFLMGCIVKAVKEQPELNSHFHDDENRLDIIGATHVGIATQTPKGLMVPVVRHCEALSIWDMAAEIKRLSECAREGTAKREELSGSTITITSLGKLGAIATTPIINRPEVAIVGINKMAVRPMWNGNEFVPRQMMNISCSFDHRIIDGWDAAVFVQKLKTLLENPAMIFIDD
ncbi:MAG: dihydrolipoamide acetyltransferase family protein [Rickettsiales bacterium]